MNCNGRIIDRSTNECWATFYPNRTEFKNQSLQNLYDRYGITVIASEEIGEDQEEREHKITRVYPNDPSFEDAFLSIEFRRYQNGNPSLVYEKNEPAET